MLLQRPHHSLRFCTPASSSPCLTTLMLLRGPQAMPPTPPSPTLTTPRTCCLPSLFSWSAFPTCLQHCLPSLRLYSALTTCLQHRLPYLCLYSALPTCHQHFLPSLRSQCPADMPQTPLTILMLIALKMRLCCAPISTLTTPALSSPPLTILTLPQPTQDMPLTPPSTPLMPNTLSAAYHPHPQVLDS
ncbi:hypothetical protein O181_040075 [Austropuccinia psidii MF-1]|uniref:Uncharacterized protein n=1 Tax=Austropuccinia psidii MF-1 TaxID=1389203 RepID=A0A9Q3DG18_9BASI|nr:hypothetical protein [Austropuccinia psidii MF-1]